MIEEQTNLVSSRPKHVTKEEILAELGIPFVPNGTGEELMIQTCYNCGKQKKLYVKTETGVFNCFSCTVNGGPASLIMNLAHCSFGEASFILYGKYQRESLKATDDDFNLDVIVGGFKKTKNKFARLPVPMQRPQWFTDLKKSDIDAYNYLRSRGLTNEIIEALNIWHWESARRIVFPVTIDGELYGTLARDYMGDQDLKVLNSQGPWRNFTVWNFDNAKDSDELVICEGAFSAIKCGINRAIALLGKVANPNQVDVIKSTNATKIYICLDVGTSKDQFNLYRQLVEKYPNQIYNIEMPPIRLVKCPSCHKKSEIDERKDESSFSCPSCSHSLNRKESRILISKSEYKDSGDYTFSEMDQMIKDAKLFQGGPRW